MKKEAENSLGQLSAEEVRARLERSARLWERYLAAGGSLAPEYDPSDPMHEFYLAEGIYEQHSIPSSLVREDVDFESLIEMARNCDSLESAYAKIQQFIKNMEFPKEAP